MVLDYAYRLSRPSLELKEHAQKSHKLVAPGVADIYAHSYQTIVQAIT